MLTSALAKSTRLSLDKQSELEIESNLPASTSKATGADASGGFVGDYDY